MSVLTAVCLVCNAHIVEDQKQFETHYETHHRRRRLNPTEELANSSKANRDVFDPDPPEQWEFLFTDDVPVESTAAQLDQAETQNCQESEAHRTVVESQLYTAESAGQLAIEVDMQLDQNLSETHPDATQNSYEEMVIDSKEIQLIREVLPENVRKEPQRTEICKTPVLLKMENFMEETLMKNHSAETIVSAEQFQKRLDWQWNAAESVQPGSGKTLLLRTEIFLKGTPMKRYSAKTIAESVPKRLDSQSNSVATEDSATELIRAQLEMNNSTPTEFGVAQVNQHLTTTEANGSRVGNVVKRRRNCGPLSCLQCGKSFLHLKILRCHWYTHGTTKFPCDLCGKIYSQPNSLREHKRGAHRTQIKFALCEELPTESTVVQLDRNQSETHLNASEVMVIDSKEIQLIREVLPKNVRKEPQRTEICKTPMLVKMENFVEEKPMISHSAETIVSAENGRKRLDSQSSSDTIEDFATELIRAQLEMNNSTPIEFEDGQVDQHSTTTETNANRVGILVKTPLHSGRFKCFLCGKSYAHPVSLRHHLYTHGKTKFPCSECGKICVNPKSLYEHKRVVHPTKDRPIHRNNEGDNSVTTESTLVDHSYSQANLNTPVPHSVACELCGKVLAGPVYLRRHLKRLHPTEADLIGECLVCHKQFAYQYDLRQHSVVHRHRNLNESAVSSTQ